MEPNKAIEPVTDVESLAVTKETVRKYLCPTASDQELILFLNNCSMFGLNPFKREIYLVKYGNNPASTVVGYETYLKRADRSEKWGGMESGTEGEEADMKAWVKVYRKDWAKPLYHEVYYTEYVQRTRDGVVTKFWREKPRTMLKKVAISQALRMAFPDEFGGMPYTAEEMNNVQMDEIAPTKAHALPPAPDTVNGEIVDPGPSGDDFALSGDESDPLNDAAPVPDAPDYPKIVLTKTDGKKTKPLTKYECLPLFAKIRTALGDESYYRVLNINRYEHANEIPMNKIESIWNDLVQIWKNKQEEK